MIVQQVEPVANRSSRRRPTSFARQNSQKPADVLCSTRLFFAPINVKDGASLWFLQARALLGFRALSELVDRDLVLQQKFACDPLSPMTPLIIRNSDRGYDSIRNSYDRKKLSSHGRHVGTANK